MRPAKIQFSKKEMDLLSDPSWILTKNDILEKLQSYLGNLYEKQKTIIENKTLKIPDEVRTTAGKISKGENYKGLPWLVLDYPRYFVHTDIFAIRTMFWWGNFFSTTLHLSGRFKEMYYDLLASSYSKLHKKDFQVCISDHQWHHTFEKTNYKAIDQLTAEESRKLEEKEFIKLAKKNPLKQPEPAVQLKDYEILVKLFSL